MRSIFFVILGSAVYSYFYQDTFFAYIEGKLTNPPDVIGLTPHFLQAIAPPQYNRNTGNYASVFHLCGLLKISLDYFKKAKRCLASAGYVAWPVKEPDEDFVTRSDWTIIPHHPFLPNSGKCIHILTSSISGKRFWTPHFVVSKYRFILPAGAVFFIMIL